MAVPAFRASGKSFGQKIIVPKMRNYTMTCFRTSLMLRIQNKFVKISTEPILTVPLSIEMTNSSES